MVGREIEQIYPVRDRRIGEEVFRAEKLRRTGYFYDVSFSVRTRRGIRSPALWARGVRRCAARYSV